MREVLLDGLFLVGHVDLPAEETPALTCIKCLPNRLREEYATKMHDSTSQRLLGERKRTISDKASCAENSWKKP